MAKSLNQAFIKAYSKGRRSGQEPVEDADQFIVRVDTATVPIPEPHLSRPIGGRRPVVPVVAGVPAEKVPSNEGFEAPDVDALSQPHPQGNANRPGDDLQAETPESTDAVRESIASQMLQAGGWQDQQIDAFIGGFPMISSAHTPDALDTPADPPSPTVASQRDESQPTADEMTESKPPAPDAGQMAPAITAPPPELAPPTSPALSFDDVEKAVTDLSQRQAGEIFRLDRPSYSAEQATTNPAPAISDVGQDSGEESSIIGSTLTDESDGASGMDAPTKEVEQGLWNARTRIFNPVWEVDSLQWPTVCSELLKQGDQQMRQVAENLMSACQEGMQVLAVTSPQGGEGRTTVACCLAMLAGSHGLNVAFVDGDIENPTLSLQTNLDVQCDWKNAIVDQMPLEDVAVHSIDDQVTLLPLVQPIDQTEMDVHDNRIALMLHELSESFDLVIVDMGPMDSARSLVTAMGEQGTLSAVVTVVDHRTKSAQRIESCIQRLRRTGISSIGLVENFAA